MKTAVSVLALTLLSQACTTISFVRDPKYARTHYSEWHHNWFFGLMEGSDPVDMNARCNGNDWRTITTEYTFIQGLVSGITYQIYDPHGLEYSCMKPASGTQVPVEPSTPAAKKR